MDGRCLRGKFGERKTMGTARLKVLMRILTQKQPITVSDLARHFKVYPISIMSHLEGLRRAGLVSWEYHKQGTIHATCKFIPME